MADFVLFGRMGHKNRNDLSYRKAKLHFLHARDFGLRFTPIISI